MNTVHEPSIEMLRLMLDSVDGAVYAFDANRRIIYGNRASQALVGAAGDPIGVAQKGHLSDNLYFDVDGNPLDIPGKHGSMIDRALRGEATHECILEHRNVRRHEHRWVKISCIPSFAPDGSFAYGILTHRDISAEKNTENKLRFLTKSTKILSVTMDFNERLQKKAALTVPSLADWCAIDIKNPDGTTRRAALIHRDPEKIHWLERYDRDTLTPSGQRPADEVIRTGKPLFVPRVDLEDPAVRALFTSGQIEAVKALDLSSTMVLPIGSPEHTLGALSLAYAESKRTYSRDDLVFFEEFCGHLSVVLENSRLYSEIKARDLAKDTFLASLSHELRNPLAPIKSSLELLRLKESGNTLPQEIVVIEHQFDHMARLLNDLLDTTRFASGRIRLDMQRFELTELVGNVIRALKPLARDAGITLQASYPEHPIELVADRTRIEQTISNILNNALKFTPRGGSITLTLVDGDETRISVKDTGHGITPDEMPKIFEPYYQSARVRRGNSGLGVGLHLVREIVRMHGGDVSVTSEAAGKGSEFVIRLPREASAQPARDNVFV